MGGAMAMQTRFRVDPRLATLLGEGYRSSEEALRELVDNAWDAEAGNVWITLPVEVTGEPIVVEDDGVGMTEKEVREEYLLIARDRRSRKGDRTPTKKRRVKGRKGIGKFAGLIAADTMTVVTRARGKKTRITINKSDLLGAAKDLEAIDLPAVTEACLPDEHGSTITLTNLSQALAFPNAERLREILIREYLHHEDFRIHVNGDALAIEDLPGTMIEKEIALPSGQTAKLTAKLVDGAKAPKHAGVVYRVGGKVVGRATTLGIEGDETIPPKLLRRLVGEIQADALENDVTSDWGAIVENSKAFQEIEAAARATITSAMNETYKAEINLQKGRLTQQAKRRLAELPENRRRFAEEAVQRVMHKFYGESPEKIEVVVSVMLDAFERDEYWIVLKQIDESTRADVAKLAEVLDDFGLVDLATIGQQARSRLRFLDELDTLARNPATVEAQLHKAIERNLWVLGRDYALVASNKTLRMLISEWVDKEFAGPRASKRPDLFLAEDVRNRLLLIEFKRPTHDIGRDDENQAIKYRDDLARHGDRPIDILMLGRGRAASVSAQYKTEGVAVLGYSLLISSARNDLEWLVTKLGGALDV